MLVEKTNTKDLTFWGSILGIIVFVRCQPYFFWSIEDIIRPTCAALTLLICFVNLSKEKHTKIIFILLAAAYAWAVLIVDNSGIITLANFLAFAFIPVLKREIVYITYSVFRVIFISFLTLSIINYFFYVLGLSGAPDLIEPLNSIKSYKYDQYLFLVVPHVPIGDEFHRFHGLYDEPGMLGTLCGLQLIAERMNFSRKGNLIILLGGIMSLSLYFYVALGIGLLLFSNTKHRYFLIALLFILALATYNIFYDLIWYRFEWNKEEGNFVGDNRNGGGLNAFYESLKWSPLFFTGVGSNIMKDYAAAASLKLVILKHGLIFVALNFMAYGLLAWKEIKEKKEWLIFMVFFFFTLYQRPGFYATYSIFMYTMVIYKFADYTQKKQKHGI